MDLSPDELRTLQVALSLHFNELSDRLGAMLADRDTFGSCRDEVRELCIQMHEIQALRQRIAFAWLDCPPELVSTIGLPELPDEDPS